MYVWYFQFISQGQYVEVILIEGLNRGAYRCASTQIVFVIFISLS